MGNEFLVSKVIVHDHNVEAAEVIRNFCNVNNLVGLRDTSDIMALLSRNIDLGAVLLSEQEDEQGVSGLDLGVEIHRTRYELPIFLRRESSTTLEDLTPSQQDAFAGAFTKGDMSGLKKLVDEYLFNIHYPDALVKGVMDMTKTVLDSWCHDIKVVSNIPYLVKDQLVYGEMVSLIPLESDWCRGYMMMQIEEKDLLGLMENGNIMTAVDNPDYHDINDALGELTNLVWGSFRQRYLINNEILGNDTISRVPIISNHRRSYISFGTSIPQLAFKFRLIPHDDTRAEIQLYQKFIFNLNWDPDHMPMETESVDDLVDSGELEML